MSTVNFSYSFINGLRQYAQTPDFLYRGPEFASLLIGGLSSSEGFTNLDNTLKEHMDIHDVFQIFGDGLSFLTGHAWIKEDKITNEEKKSYLVAAISISALTLDTLTIVAVCGGAKLLDLGKLAAEVGQFDVFGVAPLAFVTEIALVPSIRVVYICLLVFDSVDAIRDFRNAPDVSGNDNLNINHQQIRREALFKVARNVTRISLQALLLTASANPALILGFGVVASLTGMTEGVMKTDSMRQYFNFNNQI